MSLCQSSFAEQFQTALVEFRKLRQQQTRTSACGQKFVLVSNVTARLRQRSQSCPTNYQDDLDRLGQTAYLRENLSPPPLRTQQLHGYLTIFYNLLDINAPSLIHEFRNNDLATMPIEIDVLRKQITAPPDYPSFHDKFYRNQFAWCPIRFEMDMGTSHGHNVHTIICPFVRKEKIKPYRDGKRTRVNKATLYAIDVPEELVGSKLQKRMASAIFEHQEDDTDGSGNRGKIYRFALKQFDSSKHKHFISEQQMFVNLKNKEGMIQYIGWFRSYEPDDQGRLELYWNIVLELADFDFYTAIRRESPPISGKEILGFWQTMAEVSGALASIHTVVVDRQQYLTWHGDIKPENILWANGRFKLADPGEARMLPKSAGASEDQTIELIGGTRTYGAPEKVGYLDGLSQQRPEIPQTSDVWSLGCIFSIAATYVVLGTQGVLIFNRLRREATLNITEHSSDAFHDGKSVLLEVRHWHKYLREAARKNDAYTHAVLDMVDGHMLVEKDRWSAERICQEFDRLFTSTRLQVSEVPASLNSLLQRIEVNSEQLYDQHSGIKGASSDEVARQMTQKTSKSPANVGFESRQRLLEPAIQRVEQRSQNIVAPPSSSPK